MRNIKESIDAKIINDYYRIRMQQYIEKFDKGMTKEQENEFYSNIMEIASLIDYCYISTEITNTELIKKIREMHYMKKNKEIANLINNIL